MCKFNCSALARILNDEILKIIEIVPSTSVGQGGWITRSRDPDHADQHGETPSLLKIQKISWAWWRVPVIPATQEAQVGESLELRRSRLQ